jgi:hypothetical protein
MKHLMASRAYVIRLRKRSLLTRRHLAMDVFCKILGHAGWLRTDLLLNTFHLKVPYSSIGSIGPHSDIIPSILLLSKGL